MMAINDEGWGKASDIFNSFEKQGGCYPKPLSLSGDDDGHYLGCVVHNTLDKIELQHWNKNGGDKYGQRFYKGTRADCFKDKRHKRGAIIGTFVRMGRNSSTNELLRTSLKEKMRELTFLGYSTSFLKSMLHYMQGKMPHFTWCA